MAESRNAESRNAGFGNAVAHWLDLYDQTMRLGHDAEIKRELRTQDDLFMFLCFSEMMGIPNPVTYYTLELYPILITEFHQWHKRMGMDKSPLDHVRCC